MDTRSSQCWLVLLAAWQVGGNFPLYGCCWYVREMLHRPPYLARQEFRNCRAPFRQCMIAAPRCYCLLSHYPFFDLHFRVGHHAAHAWLVLNWYTHAVCHSSANIGTEVQCPRACLEACTPAALARWQSALTGITHLLINSGSPNHRLCWLLAGLSVDVGCYQPSLSCKQAILHFPRFLQEPLQSSCISLLSN